MKQISKFKNWPPEAIFELRFNHEHDVLLQANNKAADKWLRRIKFWGPWLIMLWVFATHKAIPSDQGLMVWGKKGVIRLGDMAMMYRYDWRAITVIWLQSSRQKAWLHGVRFPANGRIDQTNMDEKGRAV